VDLVGRCTETETRNNALTLPPPQRPGDCGLGVVQARSSTGRQRGHGHQVGRGYLASNTEGQLFKYNVAHTYVLFQNSFFSPSQGGEEVEDSAERAGVRGAGRRRRFNMHILSR
jgi:hypothetical protein